MGKVSRKKQEPSVDVTPWWAWGSLVAALVLHVVHLPGFFVWWLGLTVAAWSAKPPILTGKGEQSAGNEHEEQLLRQYRAWRAVRSRLWVRWLPYTRLSWWVSVLVAVSVFVTLPRLALIPTFVGLWECVVVVAALSTMIQHRADSISDSIDPFPSPALKDLKAPSVKTASLAALLGAVGGIVLFMLAKILFPVIESLPIVGFTPSNFASPGLASMLILPISGAIGGFTLACRAAVKAPWEKRGEARAAWKRRFKDRAPKIAIPDLIDHEEITEQITVDTFLINMAHTMSEYIRVAKNLEGALPSGSSLAVLRSLEEDGSLSNTRLRFVSLASGAQIACEDAATDPAHVGLMAEFSLYTLLGEETPVLTEAARITTIDSEAVAFMASFNSSLEHIRSMQKQLSAMLDAPVLLSDNNLFIGSMLEPEAIFDKDALGVDGEQAHSMFTTIADKDWWHGVWAATMRNDVNTPTYHPKMSEVYTLPGGGEVRYAAFVTLKGQAPKTFFGKESELATAIEDPPFVSIQPFPGGGGTRASRHAQAFSVVWSKRRKLDGTSNLLPNLPQDIPACTGPQNRGAQYAMLAHFVVTAFVKAKLPMPLVTKVTPLTRTGARGAIWKVDTQLEDCTFAQVRAKSANIAQSLGVPWLRMESTMEGAAFYMGAVPNARILLGPTEHKKCAELDWVDVWSLAKVVGADGETPKLIESTPLPENESVSKLRFALPATINQERVRAAKAKLRAAAGLAFLEINKAKNPREIEMMSAAEDPIPSMAPTDFDLLQNPPKPYALPFGLGYDGAPRYFLPSRDISLMCLGMSGSGKSVTLQSIIAAAIAQGYLVAVADPSKGGVDFAFGDDWYIAPRQKSTEGTLAMLKALYEEVRERKGLHDHYSVGKWTELPEEVRRPPVLLVIDEFTSLVMPDTVPPKSSDPSAMRERSLIEQSNSTKAEIGTMVGKFLREARSVGVATLIGTQKLDASTLKLIPGASDAKSNASRMILGSPSVGDRQSVLKRPFDAPDLPDAVPPGRGLFESSQGAAEMFQSFFTEQQEVLHDFLTSTGRGTPSEDQMLDVEAFVPRKAVEVEEDESGLMLLKHAPLGEEVEELDMDFSDIDFDLDEDEIAEPPEPSNANETPNAPILIEAEEEAGGEGASLETEFEEAYAMIEDDKGPVLIEEDEAETFQGFEDLSGFTGFQPSDSFEKKKTPNEPPAFQGF